MVLCSVYNFYWLLLPLIAYSNFEVEWKTLCHTCHLNDCFFFRVGSEKRVKHVFLRICVKITTIDLAQSTSTYSMLGRKFICLTKSMLTKRWIKHIDTPSEGKMRNANVTATLNFGRTIKKLILFFWSVGRSFTCYFSLFLFLFLSGFGSSFTKRSESTFLSLHMCHY